MKIMDTRQLLERHSFIKLDARSRAKKLLDEGTFSELLDPFQRLSSPWLVRQGIMTQADDGTVVAKGTVDGEPAVVLAIDGGFQDGRMDEVSAAKIAGSLELAAEDNRNGIPTRAVILFETGGVRLQEANLGLAAIAEIHAGIVDLRRYQPVIGITAGPIGCYGGMSIAAGLCSYLIGTRDARLGLNGPAVIEQEAGIAEFDSRDRPMIWSFTGCEQRHRTGLVDVYADDDAEAIRAAVMEIYRAGRPEACRSERVAGFLKRLSEIDPGVQATPERAAAIYGKGFQS
jgi:malonate decarboxylase beta subunit